MKCLPGEDPAWYKARVVELEISNPELYDAKLIVKRAIRNPLGDYQIPRPIGPLNNWNSKAPAKPPNKLFLSKILNGEPDP